MPSYECPLLNTTSHINSRSFETHHPTLTRLIVNDSPQGVHPHYRVPVFCAFAALRHHTAPSAASAAPNHTTSAAFHGFHAHLVHIVWNDSCLYPRLWRCGRLGDMHSPYTRSLYRSSAQSGMYKSLLISSMRSCQRSQTSQRPSQGWPAPDLSSLRNVNPCLR